MIVRVLRVVYCSVLVALFLFSICFGFVQVDGTSMESTLHDNTVLMTIKSANYTHGDIVCCKLGKSQVCKRLIGMEGDHIKVSDGVLYRNDKKVAEIGTSDLSIELKTGEVFLVGDNYKDSYDSRAYGAVAYNDIQCKVLADIGENGIIYKNIVLFIIVILEMSLICVTDKLSNKNKGVGDNT